MHAFSRRPPVAALLTLGLFAAPALAAPPAPLRAWPLSARGDRDVNVRAVQFLLGAHGYPLPADGVFGPATEKALQRFQRAHRLIAGGGMNNATWEGLLVPLRLGSRGPAVEAAQVELRDEGYAVTVDGVFGPRMRDAVRKFQARTGHTADGVVGRYTWYELVGGNDPPAPDND